MGVFKKFIGGIAEETISLESAARGNYMTFTVPEYKDINGTSRTTIVRYPNTSAYWTSAVPYSGLIPYATADDISNYSITDYQITPVGTITYTSNKLLTATGGTKTFSITVANNTSDDIVVKCIKFQKLVYYDTSSTSSNCSILACAYYLEQNEWMTVPAGETRALSVVMTVGG